MSNLARLFQACETILKLRDEFGDLLIERPDNEVLHPLLVSGRCKQITQHALDRYRERTGSTKGDEATLNKIASRIANAVEYELKERFKAVELIDHGTHSRYFRHMEMMFVVDDGVVVTAHKGEADRWVLKQ